MLRGYMENKYTSVRIADGKPRRVIVDDNGNIINNNPTKEELKCLDKFPEKDGRSKPRPGICYTKNAIIGFIRQFYEENGRVPAEDDFNNDPRYPTSKTVRKYFGSRDNAIRSAELWNRRYNETNVCDRCGRNFEELERSGKFPIKEYDEKGNWTGKWDCHSCREKYDPNSSHNVLKSMANCRTGNQNPNHSGTKGDKDLDIVCELYGYINLNKRYDKYNTDIDCLDEKTGLLYQVQGRLYKAVYRCWTFGDFEIEWMKEYEDMICICKSRYGNRIERIYRFPLWIIIGRKGITIYNNDNEHWYDQYIVKDSEELRRANDILKRKL